MVKDYNANRDKIVEVVKTFSNGASMSDILAQLDADLSRRSLNRRLTELVNDGLLKREGTGPTTRYWHAGSIRMVVESEEILQYLSKPVSKRSPAEYQRKFLESYVPNKTFYLSDENREWLWEVGKQPNGEKPAGTFARKIFDRLLIDLTWNSSRLEGNTYSLLETERLLKIGEVVDGKSIIDAEMILNHKQAIEFLVENVEEIELNQLTTRNMHALLSDGLLGNSESCGKLRTIPVGISGTAYQPLTVPQLIQELFELILDKASKINDPFEQSFFLMVHLPYLQPFEDVNKRVSRLMANVPLMKKNLCPLAFVDVPEEDYVKGILGVYELNKVDLLRDVFLWAYKRSTLRYSAIRHTLGGPDPFRVKHRDSTKKLVYEIVYNQMGKLQATQYIQSYAAANVEKSDRSKFVEIIEVELNELHDGNIMRYKIKQDEFFRWVSKWDSNM